jgi:hypothetical protein
MAKQVIAWTRPWGLCPLGVRVCLAMLSAGNTNALGEIRIWTQSQTFLRRHNVHQLEHVFLTLRSMALTDDATLRLSQALRVACLSSMTKRDSAEAMVLQVHED